MRSLQIGVALVQRMALAVVVQRQRPGTGAGAHGVGGTGVFVKVVAEEDDRVRLVGHQVAPGTEVAVLPTLARGIGQAQAGGLGVGRRQGAGAARRADPVVAIAAEHEAVEIAAVAVQPGCFDMHAVSEFGQRLGLARLRDAREGVVVRQLPAHRDRSVGQRRATEQAGLNQPRPQHHAVMPRRAAGHAQREGVGGQPRLAPGAARQPQRAGGSGRQAEQVAAVATTHRYRSAKTIMRSIGAMARARGSSGTRRHARKPRRLHRATTRRC